MSTAIFMGVLPGSDEFVARQPRIIVFATGWRKHGEPSRLE